MMEKENEDGSEFKREDRSEQDIEESLDTINDPGVPSIPQKEENKMKQDTTKPVLSNASLFRRTLGLKPKGEQTKPPLSKMGGGRAFPPDLPGEASNYVVEFEGPLDPTHPQNWPMSTK